MTNSDDGNPSASFAEITSNRSSSPNTTIGIPSTAVDPVPVGSARFAAGASCRRKEHSLIPTWIRGPHTIDRGLRHSSFVYLFVHTTFDLQKDTEISCRCRVAQQTESTGYESAARVPSFSDPSVASAEIYHQQTYDPHRKVSEGHDDCSRGKNTHVQQKHSHQQP